MTRLLALVLLFSVIGFSAMAQNPALNCGTGRYTNDVFENVTKTTGVTFGFNTVRNYATNQTAAVELKFDFYEPQGDVATQRPLVILAFGGSFITGARTDMDSLCTKLARKGYTAATIDYRLIANNALNIFYVYSSQALLADEIIKASSDMKAAIRYFKKDAATTDIYKIDPTKIIVGGYSAGAITALQTAYTDDVNENQVVSAQYAANGGFEGNTDLPSPNNLLPTYNSTGIVGVLNIAGAVADVNVIDAINPPLYSAQGDNDQTVPYNSGTGSYSPFVLYGGNAMKQRADQIGLNNLLWTIGNGVHSTPMQEYYLNQIAQQSATFFQPIVCSSIILPVTLKSFSLQANNCTAMLHWETATEKASSSFDIESSPDGIKFSKVASVRSKNAVSGASYNYNYQGATGTIYFRLKIIDQDGSVSYSAVQNIRLVCSNGLVQVYPNPAYDQTTISGLVNGMQVCIYNAEGKLLQTQKATNNVLQLPLNFANGLYLIQVKDVDGSVLNNTKLIKK